MLGLGRAEGLGQKRRKLRQKLNKTSDGFCKKKLDLTWKILCRSRRVVTKSLSRSMVSNKCHGSEKAIVTQTNTPLGTKLVYDGERKRSLQVNQEIFSTFPKVSSSLRGRSNSFTLTSPFLLNLQVLHKCWVRFFFYNQFPCTLCLFQPQMFSLLSQNIQWADFSSSYATFILHPATTCYILLLLSFSCFFV